MMKKLNSNRIWGNKKEKTMKDLLIIYPLGNERAYYKALDVASEQYDLMITRYKACDMEVKNKIYDSVNSGQKLLTAKKALLDIGPEILDNYRYVTIAEEDIDIDDVDVAKLISKMDQYDLTIGQPSIRTGIGDHHIVHHTGMWDVIYTDFV
jgi:hypothetical protein